MKGRKDISVSDDTKLDETSNNIMYDASEWYARFQSGAVTAQEKQAFELWLHSDTANLEEFQALDAFWDDLNHLATSAEVAQAKQYIANCQTDKPEKFFANARSRQRHRDRLSVKWLLPGVAVACTVLLGVVFTTGNLLSFRDYFRHADVWTTELGEQRRVELEDTSVVTLNTETEVAVYYSDSERRIDLIKGQAYFDVRTDSGRPFVVNAAGGRVRALGTSFDVYRQGAQVAVTLIDGKVEVSHQPSSNGESDINSNTIVAGLGRVILHPGEQLVYAVNDTNATLAAEPVDVGRVMAWRENKLDFFDTPLKTAIAEANRYSRVKIVLASEELNDQRISGVFATGRNDLVAEGIQAYFDLTLSRPSKRAIVLQAKQ